MKVVVKRKRGWCERRREVKDELIKGLRKVTNGKEGDDVCVKRLGATLFYLSWLSSFILA